MRRDEIIKSIERIEELSNKLLQVKGEIKDDELERYFYKFEKIRMDMYDDVRQTNLWLDFMDVEGIEIIDYQYKARLEDNILKIHIPEKVPSIKRGTNYVQKQIAYNVAKVVKQYEGLFYDNSVIVIIKIFDDKKIWDADNRNVKPIQDGLIQGRVIKDDNIYCSSYMVQGYYSDRPYIEVYVLPAEEITKIINQKKSKDRIKQSLKGKKGNLPPTEEQMQKLKDLGVDLGVKRITGKEIAEASISSLKDIEMADEENKALREEVAKTKEGGILISE